MKYSCIVWIGLILLCVTVFMTIRQWLYWQLQPPPVARDIRSDEDKAHDYSVDLGNGVVLDMVWMPAGSFLMDRLESEPGKVYDKEPQTKITLDGFWIAKYETTQSQYQAIMASNPSYFLGPNHPVDSVNWYDAMEFCRKLSEKTGHRFILPTEKQWEYACKAGMTSPFCFGKNSGLLKHYAWYGDNSDNMSHPVGMKLHNSWGIYDMHGNVWEWCLSVDYDYACNSKDSIDANSLRAERGGSWYFAPEWCRCSSRVVAFPPEDSSFNRGFRCVRIP